MEREKLWLPSCKIQTRQWLPCIWGTRPAWPIPLTLGHPRMNPSCQWHREDAIRRSCSPHIHCGHPFMFKYVWLKLISKKKKKKIRDHETNYFTTAQRWPFHCNAPLIANENDTWMQGCLASSAITNNILPRGPKAPWREDCTCSSDIL